MIRVAQRWPWPLTTMWLVLVVYLAHMVGQLR